MSKVLEIQLTFVGPRGAEMAKVLEPALAALLACQLHMNLQVDRLDLERLGERIALLMDTNPLDLVTNLPALYSTYLAAVLEALRGEPEPLELERRRVADQIRRLQDEAGLLERADTILAGQIEAVREAQNSLQKSLKEKARSPTA